jgi:hypothetical protein
MSIVTYNNRSIANISAVPGAAKALTHIKTVTASGDSTIDFVNGTSDVVLDSTYPIYLLKYINVHPASDSQHLNVNFRDGGSSYDATKTTTYFEAEHQEDDGGTGLAYVTASDVAQGTGVQKVAPNVGADADQSCSGELFLFNPSSTTFVKHFMMRTSTVRSDNIAFDTYAAGYCNVTAAIDAVQFSFGSGNIDAGTFKLYGLKDS